MRRPIVDDALTAQGGAQGRVTGGHLRPHRHRHRRGVTGGEQQHRDRPMAFWASLPPWLKDSPAAATHPLARTGTVPPRRPPTRHPSQQAQQEVGECESQQRGDEQRDQDSDDTGRVPALETAPLDRLQTAVAGQHTVSDRRSEQASGPGHGRRTTAVPATRSARSSPWHWRVRPDDGHHLGLRDGDDLADGVGDRGAQQHRPAHVEDRGGRRPGRAGSRVATRVAIALEASWKPLVRASHRAADGDDQPTSIDHSRPTRPERCPTDRVRAVNITKTPG